MEINSLFYIYKKNDVVVYLIIQIMVVYKNYHCSFHLNLKNIFEIFQSRLNN
jgi:hypothetical protein